MRCINGSDNNIAEGIRLHDIIPIFVYTGKINTSKSFLKQHPLKHSMKFSANLTGICAVSIMKYQFLSHRFLS